MNKNTLSAEIIAVGTELLMGQIVNTNAKFLSVELSKLAINVYHQTVIGDNESRLLQATKDAFSRSDIVIFTGGLGPTKDDLTKETIAKHFGLELVLDEESLERIKANYQKRGKIMPDNNIKQAMMPKGAIILPNDNGTAPGAIIENYGKIAIIFPGPPSEMEPMYKNYVYKYLRKLCDFEFYSTYVNIFGLGESMVVEKISDMIDNQTDPTIAPYIKDGEVTLRITTMSDSRQKADEKILPIVNKIKQVFPQFVYGQNDDTLQTVLIDLLKRNKFTVSTAESCTGGLIGSCITSVPGSSSVYKEGYITYSNEAKQKLLGVNSQTLNKYGAVSSETACEMAKGALKNSGADLAVAVTGIAGPDGGSDKKPVGLVYIAVATKNHVKTEKFIFAQNREQNRKNAMKNALNMLRLTILEGGVK